jgi:hypothetical protein
MTLHFSLGCGAETNPCTLAVPATRKHQGFDVGRVSLAVVEGRSAQVFAAELQQIEREQHGLALGLAAVSQPIEHRNAILAADDNLTVD